MEKTNNNDYDFHIIDVILNNKDGVIEVTKQEVFRVLRELKELNSWGIYEVFGKRGKECVAEYTIKELRTNEIVIKFKIYECSENVDLQ